MAHIARHAAVALVETTILQVECLPGGGHWFLASRVKNTVPDQVRIPFVLRFVFLFDSFGFVLARDYCGSTYSASKLASFHWSLSAMWVVPRRRATFFVIPYNKDHRIMGSILKSPYLGKGS